MQVIADAQAHRQHQPNKLLPVAVAAVGRVLIAAVLSVAVLSVLMERSQVVQVAVLRSAMSSAL
jgi:hypothetical protein